MSSAGLLGRKDELTAVENLFSTARGGTGILMLEGAAGIGKTTIWLKGLDLARRHGYRVLPSRPSPTEAPLAFSALGDVIGELTEGYLHQLPPPQRSALEISLLLRDDEGIVPDQRAISLATLTLLRLVAEETPLLVAVDDVQWLDAPSARVLAFVFRRIEHERCRVLLARRSESDESAPGFPFDLEYAPRFAETLERRTIGPLGASAIQSLIREKLSVRLPRRVVENICEASGGNPFYALELAYAQSERGSLDPGRPLEIPESLGLIVHERLAALPQETQRALLMATVLSSPSIAALGEEDAKSLESAVRAGMIEISASRIRFTHPLRASVVYSQASPDERRAVHARAAGLTSNREERARHLALASPGPDEEVAQELENAAAAAVARAAPDSAAELSELAGRLTPRDNRAALLRRRMETARALYVNGEVERCQPLLEELYEELGPCPERSDVLILQQEIVADLKEAIRICRQAIEEAAGDDARIARAAIVLNATYGRTNRNIDQLAAARLALEHAERCGDKLLQIEALQGIGNAEVLLGQPIDGPVMERALQLERDVGGLPGRRSPRVWKAAQLFWVGRPEEAKPLFEAEVERAIADGQVTEVLHIVSFSIGIETALGNWDLAEKLAAEHLERAREIAVPYMEFNLEGLLLIVRSMRGGEGSREALLDLRKRAQQNSNVQVSLLCLTYLALYDAALGDYEQAWRWIALIADQIYGGQGRPEGEEEIDYSDQPRAVGLRVLAVETALATGRIEEAESFTGSLEQIAQLTKQPVALFGADRSRALIDAWKGEFASAFSSFESALEIVSTKYPHPFDKARTELLYGSALRRAKRRGEAREMLTRSVQHFEQLAAAQWAARAREELERTGAARRAHSGELTPTEQQVADLVAAGHPNREVAARLFMSVRTVEANLSKIYRKLGVESRTELSRRIHGGKDL